MDMTTRLGIDDVRPLISAGSVASKAVVGEVIPVTALVWREGHDAVSATLSAWAARTTATSSVTMQVDPDEGEKKRVVLARALMSNPELLILDEPSAGMDLGGREDLVGYLGNLAMDPDAPAIVMITHHVEEIPYGFTHAMLLDEGKVVAKGLINSVLTSENLTRAFHQPIQVDRIGQRYFARRASL